MSCRVEESCHFSNKINLSIIKRIAQSEHRLGVALDENIAREKQRIAVDGAVEHANQSAERSRNSSVPPMTFFTALQCEGGPVGARRKVKNEWEIHWIDEKFFLSMNIEPQEELGMAASHALHHLLEYHAQRKKRQRQKEKPDRGWKCGNGHRITQWDFGPQHAKKKCLVVAPAQRARCGCLQMKAQENPVPIRDLPPFRSLQDFLAHLAANGDVASICEPVSLVHEVTEIHRRVLNAGGPVLRFDHAMDACGKAAAMPVIVNLFGTQARIAAGLGIRQERIGELGEALAALRAPRPLNGLRDALKRWPMLRAALSMRAETVARPSVQVEIRQGADVNLAALPIQTCWPDEPAPLITWPLVITRPPDAEPGDMTSVNIGVYRMQVLDRDRLIVRWLAHRGGAAHHRTWSQQGKDMPLAVAIGADPATMLASVLPLPETLSEMSFAGLLRGERPRVAPAVSVPLMVPADAEIVIEGWVSHTQTAPEGPYGDHTGYYNAIEPFPVMQVTAITTRRDPLYVSTFTSRPPDEPSIIGQVLNELALPLIRQQMPEIVDLYLPPAACSYRLAVVSIRKRYPGQARRVMAGLWGMLPQFNYTKAIVVVDEDIDACSGADVLWAVTTRADPSCDLLIMERTPIDYLDFASPQAGLGGKLGIDATRKIGAETQREWGRSLTMSAKVRKRIDEIWPQLGLVHGRTPQ